MTNVSVIAILSLAVSKSWEIFISGISLGALTGLEEKFEPYSGGQQYSTRG